MNTYCVVHQPAEDVSTVTRRSPYDTRTLALYHDKCNGCGTCTQVCPTEAIAVTSLGVGSDSHVLQVDPDKCILCKTCASCCPMDAIQLSVNDVVNRSLLTGRISIDAAAVKKEGLTKEVEESCPRGCIDFSADPVVDVSRCIFCGKCVDAAPEGAVSLVSARGGVLDYDPERCDGCGTCINVCPAKVISFIPGVEDEESAKVEVDDRYCIYCGTCETVCPPQAFKVARDHKITGAWAKREAEPKADRSRLLYEWMLDDERCTGCGNCAEVCPLNRVETRVYDVQDGKTTRRDPEACNGCGLCMTVCPYLAIDFVPPAPTTKRVYRWKAEGSQKSKT